MQKIKDWVCAHDDINIAIGFFPLRWDIEFMHDKGIKRIDAHFGPFALEITYGI